MVDIDIEVRKQNIMKVIFLLSIYLKKGDLLVAMTEQAVGLLGSSALVPENNTFLHNQRLGLVELTPEFKNKVSLKFLFHLFNTKKFQSKGSRDRYRIKGSTYVTKKNAGDICSNFK